MMQQEQPQPAIPDAVSLGGINIHLGYIAQSIKDIKSDIKDTKDQVTTLSTSFVGRAEFADVQVLQKDHEARMRIIEQDSNKLSGKIWGISTTVGTISSIVGFVIALIVNHIWK